MSSPHVHDSPPAEAEWRETFSVICDRHRGRLIRWVSAIFGPRDAEDIAQEALARLFLRPGLMDETVDAWPWLAVVARNVGRDIARHNAFSTSVDAVTMAQVPADVAVLDEVVARDEGERLARAMRSLTPRERHVIRLRDFDGVSIAEIAELLGSNENAVRQQLFRARRRLANVYVDLGGDSRFGTLVAAFGLRLRELARRYTPFANELGAPSAMAFGAVGPAVAGLVGGMLTGLVPGLGDDRDPPRPAVVAVAEGVRWDPRDELVRHGTGRASAPAPARPEPPRRAAPPPPPPSEPPLYDVHEDIPYGRIDMTHDEKLFDDDGGVYNEDYIYVDVPGTPYRVWHSSYTRRYPGGPTVCRVGLVQCT